LILVYNIGKIYGGIILYNLFKLFFLGTISFGLLFYVSKQPKMCYLSVLCFVLMIVTVCYPIFSKTKRFSRAELATIDTMNGIEFERYIAFLLKKNGYTNIKVTPPAGDQGIDVIATKDQQTYGFQCKRWKSNVGNKAVQEVHAGIGYYSLDKAVVLTNSYFTQPAQELAKKIDVELWDRKTLAKLLEKAKKQEIKDK
jgi:Predicted endonuclease distantly related to archaeal Holliday junction resolvase and Mrr-like restriction enzymes